MNPLPTAQLADSLHPLLEGGSSAERAGWERAEEMRGRLVAAIAAAECLASTHVRGGGGGEGGGGGARGRPWVRGRAGACAGARSVWAGCGPAGRVREVALGSLIRGT